MSRVSTHILDLVQGKPATGVRVRLERQSAPGDWELLNSAQTDQDGRCPQLVPSGQNLRPGIYRLNFDTGSYYSGRQIPALHPVVEVTIEVGEGESTFHIPLLLSPNGYTTYRGS
jgi:5-hydroxyisourate hydrolase